MAVPLLSSPPPEEAPEASQLRGDLFTDLDRLAFALEMEAATLLAEAREEDARRRQDMRLGVRLAQRLVAGIYAEEVDQRIARYAAHYAERLQAVGS